jgi:hypothetical protein
VNPFTECLIEIASAGDEWHELREWLSARADRFESSPRFSQFTNAARAVIATCGASLAARPKLRQQLLILVSQFDAMEREENDRECFAACAAQ